VVLVVVVVVVAVAVAVELYLFTSLRTTRHKPCCHPDRPVVIPCFLHLKMLYFGIYYASVKFRKKKWDDNMSIGRTTWLYLVLLNIYVYMYICICTYI
jgi:hypothetical protein